MQFRNAFNTIDFIRPVAALSDLFGQTKQDPAIDTMLRCLSREASGKFRESDDPFGW